MQVFFQYSIYKERRDKIYLKLKEWKYVLIDVTYDVGTSMVREWATRWKLSFLWDINGFHTTEMLIHTMKHQNFAQLIV